MRGISTLAGLTLAFSGMAVVSAQQEVPTGSLTVNKVTIGGDGTFNFTGSEGISSFDITTSEGSGSHVVQNLTPGFYTVSEGELPTGWTQTENTCNDNDGGISVGAGPTTTCTITNTYNPPIPTYSINGRVYNDNNPENGQLDEGEQGLEGWRVYVDLPVGEGDGNNEFDGEEAFDYSDSDGYYTISGLPRGCYTVREELQGGWNETEPTEAEEYEYDEVCIGADILSSSDSYIDQALSYLFKTAKAAVIYNAYNLNFGNVEQPRSGGGTRSGSKRDDSSTTNDDPGQVLGDTTTTPSVPLVLGATLPVTGSNPTAILLMIALLAAPMYYFRSLAVKKN